MVSTASGTLLGAPTKVCHLDGPPRVQQDVLRLQITVNCCTPWHEQRGRNCLLAGGRRWGARGRQQAASGVLAVCTHMYAVQHDPSLLPLGPAAGAALRTHTAAVAEL